jgi:TRAP-type mannitol/chloroaromatic compound transport system permease small subunit
MFLSLSRGIDKLNELIASIISWALLAAILICTGNSLMLYFFKYSTNAWTDIQWYLYAAVFLLASANTLKRDEHVRIDVIVGKYSKRTQVWIDLFGYVFFLLPFCVLLVYYGAAYTYDGMLSGEIRNVGGLPAWPAMLLIPIAFALLILQAVSEIIKRIAFLAGRLDASAFGKREVTPADEIAAIKAANNLD